MGFNDQNNALGGRGGRKFIFKEGVRFKHMTGQQAIMFRLMPAFDPNKPNPGVSYLPCLTPTGELTEWGTYLRMARFVGHGKGGSGSRQDLLSLKTFETPDHAIWCPLDALYQTINADMATWGYLIDEGDKKDKNRPRPAFGRLSTLLVANILDINNAQNGVQLGVFTTGTANKLVDKTTGLVFQPNVSPGVEEAIKQNHMWAYANGDITDPNTAPVFVIEKDTDKGEFSSYKLSVGIGQDRRVIRRPVDQALMAQRYNLADPASFLNIPTEEELVQSLVALLNMRSPMGYHEHALLKMAFPNHQIPDPPPAPAGMSTVAMGMSFGGRSGFPVSPGIPVTVPAQGYGVPGDPIPGAVPAQGYGVPGAPIPGAVPAQGYSVPGAVPAQGYSVPGASIPGAVPAQGYSVPGAVPGAEPVPGPGAVPGAVPVPGPGAVPGPDASGDVAGIVANATVGGVPPPGMGAAPAAPGDPVAPLDQAAFLAKLRGGSAAK